MAYPQYSMGRNGYDQSARRQQTRTPVVMQPEVMVDPSNVGSFVATGAVCGTLAFLINPVFGILAFFFGVRALMMMRDGYYPEALSSAKAAFWLSFVAIFLGYVAYAVLTVLLVEKADWFTDNPNLSSYLPKVMLPMFSWDTATSSC